QNLGILQRMGDGVIGGGETKSAQERDQLVVSVFLVPCFRIMQQDNFHSGSGGLAGWICGSDPRPAMRILVANDDGIYSPGLIALAKVAAKFGEVRIVSPDVEQSSMGQAISSSRPLLYRATKIPGFEAYRVNGTPADCVSLGVYNWKDIDLV